MKNSIIQELKKPITTDFSAGLYDWSIFLTNFYLRVKQVLKIDYESFMILQITLGYYLNTINKSGSNSIDDLSFRFEEIINEKTKKNSKLSVTSISSALNLPRETVPEGNGMFLVRDAMTTARKRSWGPQSRPYLEELMKLNIHSVRGVFLRHCNAPSVYLRTNQVHFLKL